MNKAIDCKDVGLEKFILLDFFIFVPERNCFENLNKVRFIEAHTYL